MVGEKSNRYNKRHLNWLNNPPKMVYRSTYSKKPNENMIYSIYIMENIQ